MEFSSIYWLFSSILSVDRRRYRDSYIYSSNKYGEMGAFSDTLGSLRGYLAKTSADQRVSVISNTSSNTTSGIVSDRMLSMDGSEGEAYPSHTHTHTHTHSIS